ncbi:hypothetical protein PAAG_04709 [Paracoccidioides lutzii Pb01]|uniref:Uncharacterized protein n=1 Tax=Paracoccidioides lutzii (strain ATCC MYA-826 / Pb01) TaxID=502779 RepID=C1H280_PARBA|nr:hypothetical protein PAAG_04709 [Paracoccidioides lutzii Pb01]EEH33660.2 hypothetical protein PAAG_04709 [Paracoccidioides lutzii Pb01]
MTSKDDLLTDSLKRQSNDISNLFIQDFRRQRATWYQDCPQTPLVLGVRDSRLWEDISLGRAKTDIWASKFRVLRKVRSDRFVVPGGFEAFMALEGKWKADWRQRAIDKVQKGLYRERQNCYSHRALRALDDVVERRLNDRGGNQATALAAHVDKYEIHTVYGGKPSNIVWVLDADWTLAAQDSCNIVWKEFPGSPVQASLEELFSGPLGCSLTAFRQATLIYEEADEEQFYAIARRQRRPGSDVWITSCLGEDTGAGRAFKTVQVICGGLIADGFVVTSAAKGALVIGLREVQCMYVRAFGSSPVDLEMLRTADQAIVVVGKERDKSKAMDKASKHEI